MSMYTVETEYSPSPRPVRTLRLMRTSLANEWGMGENPDESTDCTATNTSATRTYITPTPRKKTGHGHASA